LGALVPMRIGIRIEESWSLFRPNRWVAERFAENGFTVKLPELWSSTFSGNHAVRKSLHRKSVP
jgi:hypothetical protein